MCELSTSSDNESLSVSSLTDELDCKRNKATIEYKKIKIFGDMMCFKPTNCSETVPLNVLSSIQVLFLLYFCFHMDLFWF